MCLTFVLSLSLSFLRTSHNPPLLYICELKSELNFQFLLQSFLHLVFCLFVVLVLGIGSLIKPRWPIERSNLREQLQRFHYLHLHSDGSTGKFYFFCVCWVSELRYWCCIVLSQVLALISKDRKQQNIGFF